MGNTTGFSEHTEMAAGNCRTEQSGAARISRTPHLLTVKVEAGDGRPLNPCHPARARELIRKKRAVRISRRPYVIRLLTLNQSGAGIAGSQEDSQ
jgi:hypothetical protein